MKTRWILGFFIISLFFISGMNGCEVPSTPPGTPPGTPAEGIDFAGLNVKIKTIPAFLKEDREFNVIIDLKNNGKSTDANLKLWATNRNLGVLSSPEETSVYLEDAGVDGKIEPREESVSFGKYVYTNLKKDIDTDLKLDVTSDYNVMIVPKKDICVAMSGSTKDCSSTEIISGANLGDEASAIPITVTSIKKSYSSTDDVAYLDLEINLADVGSGKGLNNYINNFDVSLGDGTKLNCDYDSTVDIRKGTIFCDAEVNLVQEIQSSQLTISFDYTYLIKKTIMLSIKAKQESESEYLT